jgi:hypothetical protein
MIKNNMKPWNLDNRKFILHTKAEAKIIPSFAHGDGRCRSRRQPLSPARARVRASAGRRREATTRQFLCARGRKMWRPIPLSARVLPLPLPPASPPPSQAPMAGRCGAQILLPRACWHCHPPHLRPRRPRPGDAAPKSFDRACAGTAVRLHSVQGARGWEMRCFFQSLHSICACAAKWKEGRWPEIRRPTPQSRPRPQSPTASSAGVSPGGATAIGREGRWGEMLGFQLKK